MTPEIIIALIGVVPSLIAAAAAIYSVRVSQGNRRVMDRVQAQTNGLLKHIAEAAEAKGELAGAKQERDRASGTE